ncbi:MAG: hypothetical protein HW405_464 [Candidatus Berkelbacteria bacterium]|nr:hypothetical protein [Candidatus Berkelbacteria bacterium]
MFIKDRTYKLTIAILIIIFGVGLFFSARFLKNSITKATTSSNQNDQSNTLNMDFWEKIKHRFIK